LLGRSMNELTKRDWVLVALLTFVVTGTAVVILYWLERTGW
jgi:hypothetical protein